MRRLNILFWAILRSVEDILEILKICFFSTVRSASNHFNPNHHCRGPKCGPHHSLGLILFSLWGQSVLTDVPQLCTTRSRRQGNQVGTVQYSLLFVYKGTECRRGEGGEVYRRRGSIQKASFQNELKFYMYSMKFVRPKERRARAFK